MLEVEDDVGSVVVEVVVVVVVVANGKVDAVLARTRACTPNCIMDFDFLCLESEVSEEADNEVVEVEAEREESLVVGDNAARAAETAGASEAESLRNK